MMSSVETRLDGTTLVVRIPMRFQRQGGRKRIVALDGRAIVPSSKPPPDGALVKALARAWRWQKLLDDDVYTSATEIAEAEDIGKSYVSRILRSRCWRPTSWMRIWPDARIRRGDGEAGAAAAGKLGGAARSHSRAQNTVSCVGKRRHRSAHSLLLRP
jgi:hypothetical protein